jgi:hypothetical protein
MARRNLGGPGRFEAMPMQKPKFWFSVLLWIGFSVLQGRAGAQAPAQPPVAAPAPAPAASPAPAPAPDAAPAADAAPAVEPVVVQPPCFPACRDGFICGEGGQCLSACNPACGAGERCTGQGQCVIDAQVAPVEPPPPTYPPPAEPPPAETLAPPPEQGAETHDGIMLRFTIGIGGGGMTDELNYAGREDEYAGGGVMWAVDVGAGLTDELTVQARLGQVQFFGPTHKIDGEDDDNFDEGRNLSASLIGAGLTYHFMPINLYVTAIGGLSELRVTDGQNPEEYLADEPTLGFGLNLDVGKEWWVVPQTGIGVAGRFVWMTGGSEGFTSDDRQYESDRKLIAFGVVFSVTHQ